ncbi:RimJ/RimL family protein N-acetyltransferase [Scopulibacillus daqui]|uniref:RimJ/RimL family protein N-acetyltransferase n=1 Tax=Scopulibacillus daqui TaxID=1469162 RepID=A0ABS2PYN3_9BACL|nr:GNAT family N-acetyltransferase [Scopulibacillus daqui]MBM7645163.1 RimJ/RimL family protein N-acetyltransferase [Scopulibacillus daqui]
MFQLMQHPEVFPFVRHKAQTLEEYQLIVQEMIRKEANNEIISRTVIDEHRQPIGTITLYDIVDNKGFLGTWIGRPYFGKGYNQSAKEAFFSELFLEKAIQTIYLKIRKYNVRSQKAAEKIPYAQVVEHPVLQFADHDPNLFHLYEITRERYILHKQYIQSFSLNIDTLKEEA